MADAQTPFVVTLHNSTIDLLNNLCEASRRRGGPSNRSALIRMAIERLAEEERIARRAASAALKANR